MPTTRTPAAEEHLLDGSYDGPVAVRGPLRRLLLWLAPTYLVLFAIWGAVPGILLALQVERLDPAQKVANLALVTTAGALVSMLTQPVAGLISDRTRSPRGRRAPWMVAGTAAGAVLMVVLGMQHTLLGLLLGWVGVSIAYNLAQAPLTAILPDRIPRLARGSFSAVTGLGMLVGMLAGQFLASSLADAVLLAYLLLAGACLGGFTLFTWRAPRPCGARGPPGAL